MSGTKRRHYFNGLLAEIIAAIYLMFKGYKIISWRYKTPHGEIDLIVFGNNTLAFVEVKQRATIEEALFSLTPHMRSRITRAALHFIGTHRDYADKQMRFDLMAIKLPCFVRHLDNAWLEQ